MPSFPGGQGALFSYISNNMQYPKQAIKSGTQGRVIVKFIVEVDGSISNVKIGKSANPELDEEALRVVKSMPKWNPGKQDGHTVRVNYTVPVVFRLQ